MEPLVEGNLPFTRLFQDNSYTPDVPVLQKIEENDGSKIANKITWQKIDPGKTCDRLDESSCGIGFLTLLNETGDINQFLESVNARLKDGQYIILKIETKDNRAKRLFKRTPRPVGYLFYTIDFILHRILPKLSLTKNLYYRFSSGKNRIYSLPEILGRLVSSGFDIVNYNRRENDTVIIGQKASDPFFRKDDTTGFLITLRRVGINGEIIKVYKVRTMHSYSEYLQKFLFERNGTKDGDKIVNDFRITRWGRFLRKFWLDELPMLFNLLKGDIKLIGVRPLSKHKFSTYPKYLQELRTNYKPGLIPPYYADLPETPEEFFASEEKYLDEYDKAPFKTDVKYFLKSLNNIIFKGVRSR